MAESTTVLSYQISYEMRMYDLMTASQQMGDYVMACMYGEALLEFLRGEENIQKSISAKTTEDARRIEWIKYYEVLFKAIMRKVRINIEAVRAKYNRDQLIPVYTKQSGASR